MNINSNNPDKYTPNRSQAEVQAPAPSHPGPSTAATNDSRPPDMDASPSLAQNRQPGVVIDMLSLNVSPKPLEAKAQPNSQDTLMQRIDKYEFGEFPNNFLLLQCDYLEKALDLHQPSYCSKWVMQDSFSITTSNMKRLFMENIEKMLNVLNDTQIDIEALKHFASRWISSRCLHLAQLDRQFSFHEKNLNCIRFMKVILHYTKKQIWKTFNLDMPHLDNTQSNKIIDDFINTEDEELLREIIVPNDKRYIKPWEHDAYVFLISREERADIRTDSLCFCYDVKLDACAKESLLKPLCDYFNKMSDDQTSEKFDIDRFCRLSFPIKFRVFGFPFPFIERSLHKYLMIHFLAQYVLPVLEKGSHGYQLLHGAIEGCEKNAFGDMSPLSNSQIRIKNMSSAGRYDTASIEERLLFIYHCWSRSQETSEASPLSPDAQCLHILNAVQLDATRRIPFMTGVISLIQDKGIQKAEFQKLILETLQARIQKGIQLDPSELSFLRQAIKDGHLKCGDYKLDKVNESILGRLSLSYNEVDKLMRHLAVIDPAIPIQQAIRPMQEGLVYGMIKQFNSHFREVVSKQRVLYAREWQMASNQVKRCYEDKLITDDQWIEFQAIKDGVEIIREIMFSEHSPIMRIIVNESPYGNPLRSEISSIVGDRINFRQTLTPEELVYLKPIIEAYHYALMDPVLKLQALSPLEIELPSQSKYPLLSDDIKTEIQCHSALAGYIFISYIIKLKYSKKSVDDRNYIQDYMNELQKSNLPESFKYELRQLAIIKGLSIGIPIAIASEVNDLNVREDLEKIIDLADKLASGSTQNYDLFERLRGLLTPSQTLNPTELSTIQYIAGYIHFLGKIDEGARGILQREIDDLQAIPNSGQESPTRNDGESIVTCELPDILVVQKPIAEKIDIQAALEKLKNPEKGNFTLRPFSEFLTKLSGNKQAITEDEKVILTNALDDLAIQQRDWVKKSSSIGVNITKMQKALYDIFKASSSTQANPIEQIAELGDDIKKLQTDFDTMLVYNNLLNVFDRIKNLLDERTGKKLNSEELSTLQSVMNRAQTTGNIDQGAREYLQREIDKLQAMPNSGQESATANNRQNSVAVYAVNKPGVLAQKPSESVEMVYSLGEDVAALKKASGNRDRLIDLFDITDNLLIDRIRKKKNLNPEEIKTIQEIMNQLQTVKKMDADGREYLQRKINQLQAMPNSGQESATANNRQNSVAVYAVNKPGVLAQKPSESVEMVYSLGEDVAELKKASGNRGGLIDLFDMTKNLLIDRIRFKKKLNPEEIKTIQEIMNQLQQSNKMDADGRTYLQGKIDDLQAMPNSGQESATANDRENRVDRQGVDKPGVLAQKPSESVEPQKVATVENKINIQAELTSIQDKFNTYTLQECYQLILKIDKEKQAITDQERAMLNEAINVIQEDVSSKGLLSMYQRGLTKIQEALAKLPTAAAPATVAPLISAVSQAALPIAEDVQGVKNGENVYIVDNLMPLFYSGRKPFNASELAIVKAKINEAVQNGDMQPDIAVWLRAELEKFQTQSTHS